MRPAGLPEGQRPESWLLHWARRARPTSQGARPLGARALWYTVLSSNVGSTCACARTRTCTPTHTHAPHTHAHLHPHTPHTHNTHTYTHTHPSRSRFWDGSSELLPFASSVAPRFVKLVVSVFSPQTWSPPLEGRCAEEASEHLRVTGEVWAGGWVTARGSSQNPFPVNLQSGAFLSHQVWPNSLLPYFLELLIRKGFSEGPGRNAWLLAWPWLRFRLGAVHVIPWVLGLLWEKSRTGW